MESPSQRITGNILRERLRSGGVLRGIWRTLPGDELTEIIADSGIDFQIFDREHAALGWEAIQRCVRINNLCGKASLIRPATRHPVEAQRALDAGALGLVYAQIASMADAHEISDNVKFAPIGKRGFNPFVPAFSYGNSAKLRSDLNEDSPLLIPIIESLNGITDLPRMLKCANIDALYLGAYDLSVQLGCAGQLDHPRLRETLELAVKMCRQADRPVGLMVRDRDDAARWRDLGVQIFLFGVDSAIIASSFLQRFE